jgi:hypothetical protein
MNLGIPARLISLILITGGFGGMIRGIFGYAASGGSGTSRWVRIWALSLGAIFTGTVLAAQWGSCE